MRLVDLDAEFVRSTGNGCFEGVGNNMKVAHGVLFLCPLCFKKNAGKIGTHSVLCWFEGRVPDDLSPAPGRWRPRGTGLDNLTFVSGRNSAYSVQLLGGCNWHGFVRAGDAS